MKDDLGGKGAGLAEMTNAGSARASGLHHPDRSLPGIHAQRRRLRRSRPPDGSGAQAVGRIAGAEAGQGRESAAGERALGRKIFHARHDGYDSEPRPQRSKRRGAGQTQQQSPLCLRFLPPPDSDVRQCGAGNSQVTLSTKCSTPRKNRKKPSSTPISTPKR